LISLSRSAALTVVAALMSGCGPTDDRAAAQVPVTEFLSAVATGRPSGVCAPLTPSARYELERAFGVPDCQRAAQAAVKFVSSRPTGPRDYASARTLHDPYVPLGPAPPSGGRDTAGLRVILRDPVLKQWQYIDLQVRRSGAGWSIDGGVAALFTVLGDPAKPTPPRRSTPRKRSRSRSFRNP
jgi:hypothetical protein